MTKDCACGAGAAFAQCCGRYIDGWAGAPTPEALMRSRYTAYTLATPAAIEYLVATHHPSTREPRLAESIAAGARALDGWTGLRVLESSVDGDRGVVEFVASFRQQGRPGTLHERSRFVREQGRWLYVDGDIR